MTPLLFALALAAAAPPPSSLQAKLDALAALPHPDAVAAPAAAGAPDGSPAMLALTQAATATAPTASTASTASTTATTTGTPVVLKDDSSGSGPLAGLALLAVLGVGGATWWKRRKQGAVLGLRVIENASLGKGRDLVVVEHDGRRMLLAVTPAAITVLRDEAAPPSFESEAFTATQLAQAVSPRAALYAQKPEPELGPLPHPGDAAPSSPAAAFEREAQARSEDEALRMKFVVAQSGLRPSRDTMQRRAAPGHAGFGAVRS